MIYKLKMDSRIKQYPDKSSYADLTTNMDLGFTFRINSYEDLWHLGQIIEAHNHNGWIPMVTIPCLFDGQADRRFDTLQSSGLKMVCNFLNSFKAKYRIFHPHNPEVIEALLDDVEIIDNSRFINGDGGVLSKLFQAGENLNETLILMSSDAGGFKPLMKLCDKINWKGEIYSASKGRQYIGDPSELHQTKITQIVDRFDFDGKDVLIIDDICVYGGTFKGLSKILDSKGVNRIFLATSHMTIQNLGEDPVTNYFNKVFTTDSKFDNYFYKNREQDELYNEPLNNFKIIKIWN